MVNYQGKEITATLQAPNKTQLDKLIKGLNRYAKTNHLETVKVLSKAKDPDGGYKAIVEAHNWNPLKVAKERYANRPTPEAKIIAERRKVGLLKEKDVIAEEKHQLAMKKLQRKEVKTVRKNAIAKTRLETARIKQQRKEIKGKSAIGSMFTGFIKSEPKRQASKKHKSSKKRKAAQQPRLVMIR